MRPPKPNHSYVLRSCDANMQSHGGFQWPMEGQVTCPDFQNNPKCGNGLHGWLWGVGDYSASKYHANWLILEVADDDIIQIDKKVKFPKCEVLFVGSLAKAYAWLKYAPHWEEAESMATGKEGTLPGDRSSIDDARASAVRVLPASLVCLGSRSSGRRDCWASLVETGQGAKKTSHR